MTVELLVTVDVDDSEVPEVFACSASMYSFPLMCTTGDGLSLAAMDSDIKTSDVALLLVSLRLGLIASSEACRCREIVTSAAFSKKLSATLLTVFRRLGTSSASSSHPSSHSKVTSTSLTGHPSTFAIAYRIALVAVESEAKVLGQVTSILQVPLIEAALVVTVAVETVTVVPDVVAVVLIHTVVLVGVAVKTVVVFVNVLVLVVPVMVVAVLLVFDVVIVVVFTGAVEVAVVVLPV